MAKAKKRIATRRKASKGGKPSAKPPRKKAVKRGMSKKRQPKAKMTTKKGVPVIEDTIVDVIDEPVPGVVSDAQARQRP